MMLKFCEKKNNFRHIHRKTRIVDPVGFYPDPDPNFEIKTGSGYDPLKQAGSLPIEIHLLRFPFDIKS